MRITDVDPLDFDLIFERFLNPERVSLPDIDVDFCERRRGEVIDYVTRKYGRENVSQIITFGTMKARAVVRDVGRALDIPFADVDRVAKQIPAALDMTLDKALEENPALKELETNDPRVAELLAVAKRLEGMTRHASVHAAGVVIAPRPITEFAPLYKGQRDEITTQWAMKEIERIGLLKMDFLGLSTLTLLQDAVDEIKRTTGETLALDKIPLDDARTYQVFCDGQTYGIFQFESSGMRDILRKAKPQQLDDLIALNALYRPGPLRSGMIDDFIARKQGKIEIKYELPQLAPILRETYGVIAYQEQVIRIARELAGFTLGEADLLRKAMGKKNADVMQAQREKFVGGARARGVNDKKATKIFDLMEHFAGYGFPKAHSTTYALLAYQTAYLKANYPWHFVAALLTIEAHNTDKLAMYLGECRERGVPVLPPDVNESQMHFTVEPGKGVRFGLMAVKNVGEGAIKSIFEVRAKLGRIQSLHALCEHLDLRLVNKRVLESLIKAGAFDSLEGDVVPADPASGLARAAALRARLLAAVDAACEYGGRVQRDRDLGQESLFGGIGDPDSASLATTMKAPDVPAWTEAQHLAFEKEALGLYWSGHPIDRYAAELKDFGARSIADLLVVADAAANGAGGADPPPDSNGDGHANVAPGSNGQVKSGAEVSVGGIIASVRHLKTRKGDRMAVLGLEDRHGSIEVVVFPEAFNKSSSVIDTGAMVLVRGKYERDEESARVFASEILAIDSVRERLAREVGIRLVMPPHGRETIQALFDVFTRHRGDRKIVFELELRKDHPLRVRADIAAQVRVRPSETLVSEVEKICGAGSVSLR
jgi:DNA polymerase III subunit alpha